MKKDKNKNTKLEQEINFYKIIFHNKNKIPVGHFSRNLISKIKDKEAKIINHKEKNEDYFNPISDDNTIKIQKLYLKFKTIKSARKFNHSFNNKKENFFFRPLSQYTTKLRLPKNNSSPYIKSSKTRPMSILNKNSTIELDNFSSNNYSKITKYTNNIKKNILPKSQIIFKNKNKIKRSSSALLIRQKNISLNDISNFPMKNLLKQEEEMKKKKKILKARLLTSLSRHIVINKDTYTYYDFLFKNELTPEEQKLKEL